MRYPLDGTIVVTGPFDEVAQPGTGLEDAQGVSRHIGVDFRAAVGTPVKAPANGVVTQSYTAASGNQIIEMRIGAYLWRFLHLSQRLVNIGDTVTEGQIIGKSGNTGGVAPHLHVDVRKDGTTWDASLANYIDPLTLLKEDDVITSADDLNILWIMATDNPANANDINVWVNTGKTWHDVLVHLAADGNRISWLTRAKGSSGAQETLDKIKELIKE